MDNQRIRFVTLSPGLDRVAGPITLPTSIGQSSGKRRLVGILRHHAPQLPVARRVRQSRIVRIGGPTRQVNRVHIRPVRVQQPEVPLRALTRFLVLVVQREDHGWDDLEWPGRSPVRGNRHELLDDVAVVRGGVVDVGSDLVRVAAAGPPRFG